MEQRILKSLLESLILKAEHALAEQKAGSGTQDLAEHRRKKLQDHERNTSKKYTELIAAVKARLPLEEIRAIAEPLRGKTVELDHTDYLSRSALYIAVWKGQMDVALLLVSLGASIHNPAWPEGEGVLHLLAKKGYSELLDRVLCIVEHLSGREAARNELLVFDHAKNCPVRLAMAKRRYHFVSVAVRKWGYPVDRSVGSGWTMLHYQARNGCKAGVQTLLALGASPNVAKKDGLTPLHLAVLNRNVEVLRFLLDVPDVDVSIKVGEYEDKHVEGCSALEMARKKMEANPTVSEWPDIVRLLEMKERN